MGLGKSNASNPSVLDYFSPRSTTTTVDSQSDRLSGASRRTPPTTMSSPVQVVNAASSTPSAPPRTRCKVGLLRVESVASTPIILLVKAGDASLLRPGCILGRNIRLGGQRRNRTPGSKKVDLGITSDAMGVSRKQLEVKSTNPLVIKQLKVTNPVAIYFYNSITQRMKKRKRLLENNQDCELKPGDVIEIDHYAGLGATPQHVFRVVRVRGVPESLPVARPSAASAAAIDLSHANMVHRDEPKSVQEENAMSSHRKVPAEEVMPEQCKENITATTRDTSRELIDQDTGASQNPANTEGDKETIGKCKMKSEAKLRKTSTPVATQSLPSAQNPRTTQRTGQFNRGSPTSAKKSPETPRESRIEVANNGLPEPGTTCTHGPKGRGRVVAEVTTTRRSTRKRVERGLDEEGSTSKRPKRNANPRISGQPTNVTPAHAEVARPNVGDIFRVKYKTEDMFGKKYTSWFFAKVVAVKNGTESQDVRLSLSFLDKTEQTVPLSLADVQRVEVRGDLVHALVPGEHGSERVLAFDRNPNELFVGDLVDCLYQNGLDRGRWFRGRIAMMNLSMKTCNIAYDDGEYECGVPLGLGKVSLVARGFDNLDWLHGLAYSPNSCGGKSKKKANRKRFMESIETSHTRRHCDVALDIQLSDGSVETASYRDVVEYLFAPLQRNRSSDVKQWPGAERPEDDAASEPALTPKCTKARREEEWDSSEPTVPTHMEMHGSLANSLWRALNSAEPHVGSILLKHVSCFHGRMGNSAFLDRLGELLKSGPMSESIPFPESFRLELAGEYASLLSHRFGSHIRPSSWDELQAWLTALNEHAYEVEGDQESSKGSALLRRTQSVVLAASCSELLVRLVNSELETEYIEFASKPLAQAFFANPTGLHCAVQCLAREFTACWMTHDREAHPVANGQVSIPSCSQIRAESRRLLRNFGYLASYLAWAATARPEHKLTVEEISAVFAKACMTAINRTGKADSDQNNKLKLRFVTCLDSPVSQPIQESLSRALGLRSLYSIVR